MSPRLGMISGVEDLRPRDNENNGESVLCCGRVGVGLRLISEYVNISSSFNIPPEGFLKTRVAREIC